MRDMELVIFILFFVVVAFAVLMFHKDISPSQSTKKGGGRSEYTQKEKDR